MTIEVYSMACDHSNAFLMIILTIVLHRCIMEQSSATSYMYSVTFHMDSVYQHLLILIQGIHLALSYAQVHL